MFNLLQAEDKLRQTLWVRSISILDFGFRIAQ